MKKNITGFLPFEIDVPSLLPVKMEVLGEFELNGESFYITPAYAWSDMMDCFCPCDLSYQAFHSSGVLVAKILFSGSIEKAIESAKKFMSGYALSAFFHQVKIANNNSNLAEFELFKDKINSIEL